MNLQLGLLPHMKEGDCGRTEEEGAQKEEQEVIVSEIRQWFIVGPSLRIQKYIFS